MSDRPRLLVLSFSRIASDARVLKQVQLFKERYDVTTCGYGPAPEGVREHIEIPEHLVYWRLDRRLVLMRRFALAHRRNEVVSNLWDRLPQGVFDVVIANDVDTVPLALRLRPRRGVHADLHEYSPRQKEDLPRWRWFVAPYVRWLCRTYVTRAASVTTVGRGIADQYRTEFGIAADVVTNAAPYAQREPRSVNRPVRLVHSGNATARRGLEELVEAVEVASSEVSLDLYLMPTDPAFLDSLRSRASGSGRVRVHDPVPYARLGETLSHYDVGVHLLPPVNFNNLWALPNKIFDYVQARLGVIVGPSPEMAALVGERSLGAVTDGFTVQDMVRTLDALTPEKVATWKRASNAAARDLSAEEQVRGWARAIEELMAGS